MPLTTDNSEAGDSRPYAATELKIRGAFVFALGCLAVIGVVSYLSMERLDATGQWVRRTQQAIRTLDNLQQKTTDSQSNNRGYAITGDESYLALYYAAERAAREDVRVLHTLTRDDVAQQRRLDLLVPIIDAQLAFGDRVIRAQRSGDAQAARELVRTGEGKRLHAQMRDLLVQMIADEERLLARREQDALRSSALTKIVIVSGGIVAFAFVGWALFAIRRDFLARLHAEAELQRFFSLSLDFLCIASADGYFKRVSPAVTDLLGWSVEEFLAQPYIDFVHPDDRAATLHEAQRQIENGETVLRFENRYRHKNGSWRVLSWRSIPQPDGLMYATARDVTDLMRTAQELRDAKVNLEARVAERTAELAQLNQSLNGQLERLALLSHITHAIGEGQEIGDIFRIVLTTIEEQLPLDFAMICTYDPAADMLEVSRTGTAGESLAARTALQEGSRITVAQSGLARAARGQLVRECQLSALQFPLPQRLAAAGLNSLVAAPLISESSVFGVLLAARRAADSFTSAECEFLRQLSEHVALAAHQAKLYGALQSAYDDLRTSQQAVMQQERLRVLGQMASGIAHDINNSISPVTLYATLLEREPNLTASARDYVRTIQQAIRDVAGTVARMREFYRQPDPRQIFAPIQLNSVVPQLLELTRARWADMPQQRGIVIHVRTELTGELPRMLGLENEIREALTNLIFNAVDALPEGGTLTLRTGVDAEGRAPQRRLRVEVSDTGVGMSEETRRRCLEPFFTTKGERGTGLGLAMVYGIVERHGGEIAIESAPGAGTTVRLSFDAAPIAAEAAPHEDRIPDPGPLRLLIVDDDAVVLNSLRNALESDGHTVTAASSGQEAIQTFAAAHGTRAAFDAVITDLGMPYVDGRQVAAAIKAKGASTPVILLTGWGQRMIAEGELPAHVDRVLSKPPKLRELQLALGELRFAGG